MLASVIPLLDKAKESVEKEAGFSRLNLTLAEASESKDCERCIYNFLFYNFPNQETYCEVEISKKDGEMLAFRRLESDEKHPKTIYPPRLLNTKPNNTHG